MTSFLELHFRDFRPLDPVRIFTLTVHLAFGCFGGGWLVVLGGGWFFGLLLWFFVDGLLS